MKNENMAKYKILVLPSDHCGCGKYRSIDPHLMLQKKYPDLFECVLCEPKILYNNIGNFIEIMRDFDMIHIHKQLDDNARVIQLMKYLGKKVVLDLDDHYVLGPTHPMHYAATTEKWHLRVLKHLQYADYVTTTTEFFKNLLLKHNKNVAVLPNAIFEGEKQFENKPTESDKLRLGIVCGSTHYHDLMLLKDLTKSFTPEEREKIQFVLCGFDTRGTKHMFDATTGEHKTIPMDPKETSWAAYEEIITDNYSLVSDEYKKVLTAFDSNEDLSNFKNEIYTRHWTKPVQEYASHYNNVDILLAPLVENEFDLVKSQLKVIEAGFFKKGFIGSKFGPYTIDVKPVMDKEGKFVEDGNGILIENRKGIKEWKKAIKFYLENPEALKKSGENLYDLVKSRYALEKVTDDRKDLYLKILEK